MKRLIGILVMAIMAIFSSCKKDEIKPEVDNKPVIGFEVSKSTVGLEDTISVTSSVLKNGPVNFEWKFPGGTPATSLSANPQVSYSTPGSYRISAVAYNNLGKVTNLSDTVSKVITVMDDRLKISGKITNLGIRRITDLKLTMVIDGKYQILGETTVFGQDNSYTILVKHKYLGKSGALGVQMTWVHPIDASSHGCSYVMNTATILVQSTAVDLIIPSSFQ